MSSPTVDLDYKKDYNVYCMFYPMDKMKITKQYIKKKS